MSPDDVPVWGWLLLAAVLVAGGVAGVLAGGTASSAPVEDARAQPAAEGQCWVRMGLDPSALERGDRIVVEVGDYSKVVTDRRSFWTETWPGNGVTAYGVELGGGDDGSSRVLLRGYVNADCELVRFEGGSA